MKVKEIMRRDVGLGMIGADENRQDALDADAYCFEQQDADEVARFMEENRLHRLIVINRNGRFVGVVSLADIQATDNPMLETSDLVKEVDYPERRVTAQRWLKGMDRRLVEWRY